MFSSHNLTPSILIVDDNIANLYTLHEAVKGLGQVFVAKNGIAALETAKQCLPDIILLDIEMPDLSGYQVLERLKTLPELRDPSVVFVTAHIQTEFEIKALEAGGVDFIHKPIDLSLTRARVKNQLALITQRTQLKRNAEDMSMLVKNLPAFIGYWDAEEKNIFCNDYAGDWFGIPSNEMTGKFLREIVSEPVYKKLSEAISFAKEEQRASIDIPCGRPNQNSIHGQVTIVGRSSTEFGSGFLMLITDITPRKIAEQALIDEKERIRITLNSIGDAVIAVDTKGCVTFLNPIAEKMTGWATMDAVGRPIEAVMPLKDSESGLTMRNPVYLALSDKRIVGMTLNCMLSPAGQREVEVEDSAAPIINHRGELTGAIIVFHDVSEAKAMALKMTHLAQHDVLTNLPNRLLLRDRAHQALQKASRTRQKVALLLFDIDHFKNVNETVGHETGDLLIKRISEALSNILRNGDTLCRQGGDEFVVLMTDIENSIQTTRFISRLFDIFAQEWQVDHHSFNLTISLGASIYPDDSSDLDDLYRHADAALFTAKKQGRNQYQFYGKDIDERLALRHELDQSLKNQERQREMTIHFQPKVNVLKGKITGVEALVRWQKSDGKLISPTEFIPLAEETGLIIPLGRLILEQACQQAVKWRELGHQLRVAVNISIVQFEDLGFVDFVKDTLNKFGVDPSLIELEITESVLAKDAELAIQTIHSLRETGLKIALDDFGTGYSSLSYIKGFPIDVLKIDQSFVRNMLKSQEDKTIISAIIQMARGLNLALVAEGVETKEHLDLLKQMGCEIMQGYLFSKPVTAEEITEMLRLNSLPYY